MKENKLACCIVRDLLPPYIEELTEPETTTLINEHLEECPDCRQIEQDMRKTVSLKKPPEYRVTFLKRVKRTRLIAAGLSILVAIWCICWLYDQEFHYPNTEAGRLAAIEDYIPSSNDSEIDHGVKKGTRLSAAAWTTKGKHLFIFYFADNSENVHGIIHLVKGINGKYRTIEADISPSEYCGGVYGSSMTPRDTEWNLFYLAGYNCRDIYHAEVEFFAPATETPGAQRAEPYSAVKSFDLSGEDFLQLVDQEDLKKELGIKGKDVINLYIKGVKLFDKDGKDITKQYSNYTDNTNDQSWNGGKTTAETFLVYVYMGIVAVLGAVMTGYFLRRD